MLWETSPAATELEEVMIDWFKLMMDLPRAWSGVIQDTASSATFCAVLAARERASDWRINESGVGENDTARCLYKCGGPFIRGKSAQDGRAWTQRYAGSYQQIAIMR